MPQALGAIPGMLGTIPWAIPIKRGYPLGVRGYPQPHLRVKIRAALLI